MDNYNRNHEELTEVIKAIKSQLGAQGAVLIVLRPKSRPAEIVAATASCEDDYPEIAKVLLDMAFKMRDRYLEALDKKENRKGTFN